MGYFIVMLWIIVLPCIVGVLLVERQAEHIIIKQWLYGQFLLWAVFHIITVPYILLGQNLDFVVTRYLWIVGVLLAVSIACFVRSITKYGYERKSIVLPKANTLWLAFTVLFIVQVMAMLFFAVNDGDDAFYMAIANIAQSGGNMYTVNAYSVGMIEMNYRYALAPFPIWLAFLTEISGIHTLVIGHVVLGVFMLVFFYALHFLLAKELLHDDKKAIAIFMLFLAVFVVWGNTSTHTPASFLITRSRQGKALVASIVLPMLWVLIVDFMKRLQNKEKVGYRFYVIIASVMLTAALGSSMGGVLCIVVWGSFCLMCAILYKKPAILLPGVISSLPTFAFAVIYLLS
ncbi:MAG: DUF6077 domain-containing protein [Lachnospiraceae bacterium]